MPLAQAVQQAIAGDNRLKALAFLCSTASIPEGLELDESAREQLQRYHEPTEQDALTKPDVFFAGSRRGVHRLPKGVYMTLARLKHCSAW